MITTSDKPTVDKVEEVSLIMALGRLAGLVNAYGPPADNGIHETFANNFGSLVFGMEDSFRESYDLVKLKKDLWHARCFAKDFDKWLRSIPVELREVDEGEHTIGLMYGEGSNMDGDYTYLHSPYASDLLWGWGCPGSQGKWTDLHYGWEEVSIIDDMVPIIRRLKSPLARLSQLVQSPSFKGFKNLGFDRK